LSMNPKVSIIIPARNEAANIGRCLDAVNSQETNRPFEVIVIDSGSTDGTGEIAARHGAEVITIAAHEFDHGRTRNLGLSRAKGKYLVTLVADAVPANGAWLEELIAPLESDPNVAGSYSRQLPHPWTNPLEGMRVLERFTAGDKEIVSRYPGDEEWEKLEPEKRMLLVNFDDVSAARRREVWEKIPIAENYWGEDLDWSLKALKAGHAIVFAPGSVVYHSHELALLHSFRRAYVDQAVVKRMFGFIYYSNMSEFRAGLLELIRMDDRILRSRKNVGLSAGESIRWRLWNPARRFIEALGAYIAALDSDQLRGKYFDFYESLPLARTRGNAHRTSFTINGVKKNVVFAHPPSAVRKSIKAPGMAKLSFFPAIKPEVWDKSGPVLFEVALDGRILYSAEVNPANESGRSWSNVTVDLDQWFGRKVVLELITRARNTDNAWAGWAEPVIRANKESALTRLKIRIAEKTAKFIYEKPMRHP